MKPRWFLGSDRNFAAERSAAPAGRAEGAANLGSDPENARSRIPFPFGLSLSKPCVNSRTVLLGEFRCRSVAAAGDLLFFVSPKKPKEKKGDPGVCVPSLRCGQPAVLASGGVPLELASLRQSRALIRLKLRSSAHSQGFCGIGFGIGFRLLHLDATIFIAACASITWAGGRKGLRTGRSAWFLGSDPKNQEVPCLPVAERLINP
jgi:hypothetical protein